MRAEVDRLGLGVSLWPDDLFASTRVAELMFPNLPSLHQQDDGLSAEIRAIHFSLQWASYGFPLFRLTHSLTAALLLTDPAGVDPHEIRWPFPSFAIALPRPDSPISYRDDERGVIENAEIITVCEFAWLKNKTDAPRIAKCASWTDRWALWSAAEKEKHTTVRAQGRPAAPSFWRNSRAPSEMPNMKSWLYDFTDFVDPVDQHGMRMAVRLVTNFALYISALARDGGWKKPEGKAARRPGAMTFDVGREIKLSRELRDAAWAGSAKSDGWRLSSRYVVRGHWRTQRFGKDLSEAKRVWIQPYWKGPNDGAILERIYIT